MLPGATCVLGFMRTYATFLKLDPDALVEAYRSSYAPPRLEDAPIVRTDVTRAPRSRTSAERKKQRVRRQHRSYALAGVIAVVIVALLAWFGTGRGNEAASVGAENITSSTLTTAAPLLEGTGSTGTTDGDGTGTSVTEAADGESEAGTSSSTTLRQTESTAGTQGTVTATDGPIEVVVSVQVDECWLVVREDGENGAEIFAGTLSAGGKQTFASSKSYWMMIGNPGVLTITIEGRAQSVESPAGAFLVSGAGIERVQ